METPRNHSVSGEHLKGLWPHHLLNNNNSFHVWRYPKTISMLMCFLHFVISSQSNLIKYSLMFKSTKEQKYLEKLTVTDGQGKEWLPCNWNCCECEAFLPGNQSADRCSGGLLSCPRGRRLYLVNKSCSSTGQVGWSWAKCWSQRAVGTLIGWWAALCWGLSKRSASDVMGGIQLHGMGGLNSRPTCLLWSRDLP